MNKLNIVIWVSTFAVFLLLAIVFGVILMLVGSKEAFGLSIVFSFLMIGIQWYIGPIIVKFASGAKEVAPKDAPELHKMIEELAANAGIPKPKVCIVQNNTPNAFAFGRTQKSSYVAVHTGLMDILDKEEVRAVLAHEIGHIKNRDVLVITMASVLPVILYYGAILVFSGRDGRNNILGIWFGALAAQFIGQLAVLWLSRQREYFADAHAKSAIGNPIPLSSALVKISYSLNQSKSQTNQTMRAFYIGEAEKLSPELLKAVSSGKEEYLKAAIEKEEKFGFFEIFSTHPRTSKRLKALLS